MARALGLAALVAALFAAGSSAARFPVLTVVVSGKGTVKGGAISCPYTCRAALRAGAALRLRATPAAGWRFAGWSGACRGATVTCTVRLRAAGRLGATFKRASPPAPPPPPGFTPAFLAGTWNGTWTNKTFGSTGSAQFVVATPSATSFTFRVALGGNVFGCSAPPATSGEITEGTGQNHWNADGFSIQTQTGGGGSATIAYDFKANALTGNGVSGCNPGITWSIAGSFSGNTFTGTVTISLPGGISATSVLSLAR